MQPSQSCTLHPAQVFMLYFRFSENESRRSIKKEICNICRGQDNDINFFILITITLSIKTNFCKLKLMFLFKVTKQYEVMNPLGFKLKYFKVPCRHEFVSISKKNYMNISLRVSFFRFEEVLVWTVCQAFHLLVTVVRRYSVLILVRRQEQILSLNPSQEVGTKITQS